MGRLTARVIERVSECHPPQELQMKKEIPSFYAVHPIFKWKKSGRGLERWTEMSDRNVVVTLMQAATQRTIVRRCDIRRFLPVHSLILATANHVLATDAPERTKEAIKDSNHAIPFFLQGPFRLPSMIEDNNPNRQTEERAQSPSLKSLGRPQYKSLLRWRAVQCHRFSAP